MQVRYEEDISDKWTEISLISALLFTDSRASHTGAARSSNKSCLCLSICQSPKNKVDITGMAHRDVSDPPPPVSALSMHMWTLFDISMETVSGYYALGQRHDENSPAHKYGYPLWSRMTGIALHLHGHSLSAGWLNILRRICYQKKVSRQPAGDEVDPNMYLKAACSDIPVSRQRGGPRLERCPSSNQQRQGAGTKWYPSSPTGCLPGSFEASRPQEQQSLEELLHVHSHLFQAAVRPCASMVYR